MHVVGGLGSCLFEEVLEITTSLRPVDLDDSPSPTDRDNPELGTNLEPRSEIVPTAVLVWDGDELRSLVAGHLESGVVHGLHACCQCGSMACTVLIRPDVDKPLITVANDVVGADADGSPNPAQIIHHMRSTKSRVRREIDIAIVADWLVRIHGVRGVTALLEGIREVGQQSTDEQLQALHLRGVLRVGIMRVVDRPGLPTDSAGHACWWWPGLVTEVDRNRVISTPDINQHLPEFSERDDVWNLRKQLFERLFRMFATHRDHADIACAIEAPSAHHIELCQVFPTLVAGFMTSCDEGMKALERSHEDVDAFGRVIDWLIAHDPPQILSLCVSGRSISPLHPSCKEAGWNINKK